MSAEKQKYGVHSEAGKLRKVMVCAPGLAHKRLTPSNCDELLFDDVIWVDQAKRDHFDFVTKMRERGVDVLEMHNLLTDIVQQPEALKWILDRKITPDTVGVGLTNEVRSWLEGLDPRHLAEFLIGGVAGQDLPQSEGADVVKMYNDYLGHSSFILPPLPNTQFTRDTTCWIYGGVTLNPMYWPARRQETLLTTAIYKFHKEFTGADFQVWYGDPDKDHGNATLEGGDVMPIGNGIVLIGMGERTSRQAIGQLAQNLFAKGAVKEVIVAGLPKSRAAMHLDTVWWASNWGSSCAWSRPAATASPPSANSGMTATTWWPSSRVWSSATTVTPTPIPCCARRASRSSPSAPANWAGAVAAATA